MSRALLFDALKALEGVKDAKWDADSVNGRRLIAALRAALAEPQVCPVCQGQGRIYQGCGSWIHCSSCNTTGKVHAALAKQPAPVLTDAEVRRG